jgi:hypothetical protein
MTSSRTILCYALLGSLVANLGCSRMLHELQPHRLNRLNRGPAPSLDPEFTSKSPRQLPQLAKRISSAYDETVSANSTEVVTVRSQSPAIR